MQKVKQHKLTFLKNYLHWCLQKSYCTSERFGVQQYPERDMVSARWAALCEPVTSTSSVVNLRPAAHLHKPVPPVTWALSAQAHRAFVNVATPCGRTGTLQLYHLHMYTHKHLHIVYIVHCLIILFICCLFYMFALLNLFSVLFCLPYWAVCLFPMQLHRVRCLNGGHVHTYLGNILLLLQSEIWF